MSGFELLHREKRPWTSSYLRNTWLFKRKLMQKKLKLIENIFGLAYITGICILSGIRISSLRILKCYNLPLTQIHQLSHHMFGLVGKVGVVSWYIALNCWRGGGTNLLPAIAKLINLVCTQLGAVIASQRWCWKLWRVNWMGQTGPPNPWTAQPPKHPVQQPLFKEARAEVAD